MLSFSVYCPFFRVSFLFYYVPVLCFSIVFLLFFMLFGQQVSANLFLEPYLGYALGFQNYKLKSGLTDQNVDSFSAPNGVIIGGRVGMGLGPIYITGDFSGYSWDGSIPGATPNTTVGGWMFTSMGATIIFSPPVLPVRLWAGYNFSEKTPQDYGPMPFEKTGTALKFGGSFTLIPLGVTSITVNAEYIVSTYGDFALTGSNGSVTIGGNTLTFGDLKQNTFVLSVGLPFDVPFL